MTSHMVNLMGEAEVLTHFELLITHQILEVKQLAAQ